MTNYQTQKGFTLVELAIVMTIIGLLIGGILKGQELMQNARVTATVAQVRAYEAATTTFRDKYDAMPGDMANAGARIPGCTGASGVNCNPAAAANNAVPGDGIVGRTDWTTNAAPWVTQTSAASAQPAPATAANGVSYETQLFWTHLLLADLIAGVTNASINGTAATAWGETHPAAKIGGGFVVGYGAAGITPGNPVAGAVGPSGTLLMLVSSPTSSTVASLITPGIQPISPTRAAQIDRKMDDGRPDTGYVQAYGVATSCFSVVAPFTATAPGYLESKAANDCGVVFRIQG